MTDKFYLGKFFDTENGKASDKPFFYDPDDLTTHAVVVGMTGSGKTGLCITLLEEAALQGLPAILIDPKGDLTNLMLHFPDLAPQDFQPWLDPELTRRAGKTLEQASTDAALAWRNGLTEWGIGHERLLALKNAAQFAVYTPGSDAGIPVSVLSSLAAPGLTWENNREVLTERISSTVTAILGLVGYDDIDPIRSREHILLANIFQAAWRRNQNLDLNELILQIQTPPFEKLGAFQVDAFFPPKERMALALQLNNILAAPTFDLWRAGQALDIPSLLFTADGRPRHSVFYISHLSDPERMFFVTLLLASVETWMRTQAGATSLRALLYMDEIYGYMPPTQNPPSKQPLLRMLKQARAFGLGILLSTQNPVDIDYKALSNAGTWFIGKLQTEQDKQRLLDGLESAGSKTLDRAVLDKMISRLGKRVFIMNNVHAEHPTLFQTRWAMNFLAGPLTKAQIPALNRLLGASFQKAAEAEKIILPQSTSDVIPLKTVPGESAIPEGYEPLPVDQQLPVASAVLHPPKLDSQSSQTRPATPVGIAEFFLPANMSFSKATSIAGVSLPEGISPKGMVYHPAIAASAQVRFADRKYNLDTEIVKSVLVTNPEKRGTLSWDNYSRSIPEVEEMDPSPVPRACFTSLDAPFSEQKQMSTLQKGFTDWVFRTSKVIIRANDALGLFATPDVSQAEFMKACADAAREARDTAVLKATAALDRQIKSLKDKISREERELKMDETELSQRRGEEIATHAENIFGRTRYRRLSTSLTKRRLTEQAKEDLRESIDVLKQCDLELQRLEQARQEALENASGQWGDIAHQITEVPILPKKTNIYVNLFGVAWMPYYQVDVNGEILEIPAFQ